MADELYDVILHVWKLGTQSSSSNNSNDGSSGSSSGSSWFVDRFLPNIGFGAYHTCIEYDGYFYTFAAQVGVIKSSNRQQGIPGGGGGGQSQGPEYEGAIPLGGSVTTRAQGIEILKYLQTHHFHPKAYHLIHRNCNHFTEAFATALIQRDLLLQLDDSKKAKDNSNNNNKCRLKTYPSHINRLASTGGIFIGHGEDDIVPCQVIVEARQAVGGGSARQSSSTSSSTTGQKAKSSNQKKELTAKQKAILAKIKGSK